MAVLALVGSAGDVDPVVERGLAGSLKDQLVVVAVVHDPEEPLPAGMVVGDADVTGFAKGVLGGIDASNLDVELRTSVARADDNRLARELAERFKNLFAQLLEGRDVL